MASQKWSLTDWARIAKPGGRVIYDIEEHGRQARKLYAEGLVMLFQRRVVDDHGVFYKHIAIRVHPKTLATLERAGRRSSTKSRRRSVRHANA